ncbi:MAG TPA: ABC transporter substrate-binding protein [Rhodospirillaceae bacterium]|nr:ABC transporter substrate-binding protein [Rhodospirillaceae bacterium]
MRILSMVLPIFLTIAATTSGKAQNWSEVIEKARGQQVFWNAWGGDKRINAYIAWAGDQVQERYGVTVKHVRLADTSEAVARVVAEKAAGQLDSGSVDLIWINGENFAEMKRNDLLFGPWTQSAPNYRFVDTARKKTTTVDFTVPVDHLEAPWGMAQFVFMYDTSHVENPPGSVTALLEWAKDNPGRFTYPQPPDFLGTTFLKQALIELVTDSTVLQAPATDVARITAPLWGFLDSLHPNMRRRGQVFPQNGPALQRLLDDGEIAIALSFEPAEASGLIAQGRLPDTVRTFVLDEGTIGNTNFLAIPFNANAKEGAMLLANFLMSPEAQAHKQDPEVWGSFTVLDTERLPEGARKTFQNLDLGIATLSPGELGSTLLEPHPSWVAALEAEWVKRYAGGN